MLTLKIGARVVTWTMPPAVTLLEVVERLQNDRPASGRLMALAAGLPPQVLASIGARRDGSDLIERFAVASPPATLLEVQGAAAEAMNAVCEWYVEATEDARGNSDLDRAQQAGPDASTPTTPTGSAPSSADGSPSAATTA
jgi:hypothetical protein